jgi:hypothetical protein
MAAAKQEVGILGEMIGAAEAASPSRSRMSKRIGCWMTALSAIPS